MQLLIAIWIHVHCAPPPLYNFDFISFSATSWIFSISCRYKKTAVARMGSRVRQGVNKIVDYVAKKSNTHIFSAAVNKNVHQFL